MSRHAAAVVLVLALTGCAAEPIGFEDTPATTKRADPQAKVTPSPSKTTKRAEAIPADLRKYLAENFTGTSWIDNIKAVTEEGDQDWVSTNLKATDTERASKICSAISGYQVRDGIEGFKGVRVADADGEPLAWRKGFAENC